MGFIMYYNNILNYLYSLDSPKIKLGLQNLKGLLGKIGNPEKLLKCIHVAGTNGKGSVCAMLFYVLKEAGYKVGLYTSPHFKRFNERIRINNDFITDNEIVELFLKVKPHVTNQSFFEITTAMAFLYFKEKNPDFLVLETGLGGRLDATNTVTPLVSVITNISLEHTNILGNTIEKIAFEKAGIIKENVPIVTGATGKALAVIKKIAKERNAPIYSAKNHPTIKFQYLNGGFQQQNKDIALTALEVLKGFYKINIGKNQIINGIKKTRWPGRLEFISRNVLVDCGHNSAGFQALKQELPIIKKQRKIKNLIFVVGILKDKEIDEMLNIVSPQVSSIIFTKSSNKRTADPQYLLNAFEKFNNKKSIKKFAINNPKKALAYAKKIAGKNDLVIVTGSIYMIGEVLPSFRF